VSIPPPPPPKSYLYSASDLPPVRSSCREIYPLASTTPKSFPSPCVHACHITNSESHKVLRKSVLSSPHPSSKRKILNTSIDHLGENIYYATQVSAAHPRIHIAASSHTMNSLVNRHRTRLRTSTLNILSPTYPNYEPNCIDTTFWQGNNTETNRNLIRNEDNDTVNITKHIMGVMKKRQKKGENFFNPQLPSQTRTRPEKEEKRK